jgi:hypothetical protein
MMSPNNFAVEQLRRAQYLPRALFVKAACAGPALALRSHAEMEMEPDFQSFLSAVSRRVLDGGDIVFDEALRLIEATDAADIHDLLARANRIREKFKGNRIHLCSIINA